MERPRSAPSGALRGPPSARRPTSQAVDSTSQQLKTRTRQLTICLVCLAAASGCLAPYLSLHLHQRVGLQLFESDLVQLRACLFSVILCAAILVVLMVVLRLAASWGLSADSQRSGRLQRLLQRLIALSATVSAISYLSLALVVPRIKQVTRMPMASFDCNANLITIENCHQQFSTSAGKHGLFDALGFLFVKDLSRADDERLIKKLNCLQYKDGPPSDKPRSLVGTRFLLHDCGLVCKPQRQHLRQFGDDLNGDPAEPFQGALDENGSPPNLGELLSGHHQVSLKVCFSGESSGSPNSYKQFCITNLASRAQRDLANAQTLTVGQLNEMLRRLMESDETTSQPDSSYRQTSAGQRRSDGPVEQGTHYVNPIVQFESHFKNWPHIGQLPLNGANVDPEAAKSEQAGLGERHWCKFRPIPPFIVNNKPFNDIQCSLEHEYTMTTASSLLNIPREHQIFLKRSGGSDESARKAANERCSIQCRLNIFYQVDTQQGENGPLKHYYLPLKPCLIVSNEGDKSATMAYYVLFRFIADASSALVLILLDLFLLIESLDSRQSALESKKHRIVGLLSALAIMPLVVAFIFELTSNHSPLRGAISDNLGLLWTRFREELASTALNFMAQIGFRKKPMAFSSSDESNLAGEIPQEAPKDDEDLLVVKQTEPLIDNYLSSFFIYSLLMFSLAIGSLSLPSIQITSPLVRLSSVESLGMSTLGNPKFKPPRSKPSPSTSSQKEPPKSRTRYSPMISLALSALFMGTQFNLRHIGESQIMLEAFGGDVNRWGQQASQEVFPAVWFALSASSASDLALLVLAFVFSTELSAFFSQFSFLKLFSRQGLEERQKSNANFIMYMGISLLVYSARSYILSGLTHSFSLKWPIILIVQAATTFNLPVIWLSLSARMHEIIAWRTSDAGHSTLNNHLVGESTLALVYFSLGRLLALLAHTMNTSLYLHSDDVDWFINSFYQSKIEPPVNASSGSTRSDPSESSNRLFSPLPSERQTYIYASRIFLKYNSVTCLWLATILVATFVYLRYHIWTEQRRTLDVNRWTSLRMEQASSLERDSCIDERLSADLKRIHTSSAKPRTIKSQSLEARKMELPGTRAKVLYHYGVERDDLSDSGSSGAPKMSQGRQHQSAPTLAHEFKIPIALSEESADEEDDKDEDEKEEEAEVEAQGRRVGSDIPRREEVLERKIVRVRKAIRLMESEPTILNAHARQLPTEPRKRSISFAPTATLIGGRDSSSGHYWHSTENVASKSIPGGPKCASPEPSIEDSDDNDADKGDHDSSPNHHYYSNHLSRTNG